MNNNDYCWEYSNYLKDTGGRGQPGSGVLLSVSARASAGTSAGTCERTPARTSARTSLRASARAFARTLGGSEQQPHWRADHVHVHVTERQRQLRGAQRSLHVPRASLRAGVERVTARAEVLQARASAHV